MRTVASIAVAAVFSAVPSHAKEVCGGSELERYFPQIAHNPKDSCEERALAEWAIRSFTREEMIANREKLDRSAPIGATCKEMPAAN